MSYSGWASVLLNSLAAMSIALALPRISCDGKPSGEGKAGSLSRWIPFLAIGLMALAAWRLSCIDSPMEAAMRATWLSALALAGTALKWVLTVLASRGRSLHERSLGWSLLVSPLGLFLLGRILPESDFGVLAVCWFANGFFWQAVVDDGERMFS